MPLVRSCPDNWRNGLWGPIHLVAGNPSRTQSSGASRGIMTTAKGLFALVQLVASPLLSNDACVSVLVIER